MAGRLRGALALKVLSVGAFAMLLAASVFSDNLPELTQDERANLARQTVEDYYQALAEGDVYRIGELLTGSFAESRKMILEADHYDRELRQIFGQSSLEITKVDVEGPRVAHVDGVLSMASGERMSVGVTLSLIEDGDGYTYRVSGERTTSRL